MHNNLNVLLIAFFIAIAILVFFISGKVNEFINHYFNYLQYDFFKNKKKYQEIKFIFLDNEKKILNLQNEKDNISQNIERVFQEEYAEILKKKFLLEKNNKIQYIERIQRIDKIKKYHSMIDDLFDDILKDLKNDKYESDILL